MTDRWKGPGWRRPTRSEGTREREHARWPWPAFAAPGIVWLLALFVLPAYVIVSVAFGTVDLFQNPFPIYQPWYWSTEQVSSTLRRICCGGGAIFQGAYVRTFTYVAIASVVCVVLGYAVAYYVARYGGRRRGLYLVLLVSPLLISYLMRMFAWQSLLAGDGFVNRTLRVMHVISAPINWQDGNPVTVIFGLVYGYIPYMVLALFAALDRIDANLLEAGRDLGADPVRTFLRVTLPLSKQAILAGLVIVSLPMFGDYYTNSLLSPSPRVSMIGNLISDSLDNGRPLQAATLVITLVVILLIPMTYYLRSTSQAARESLAS